MRLRRIRALDGEELALEAKEQARRGTFPGPFLDRLTGRTAPLEGGRPQGATVEPHDRARRAEVARLSRS